MPYVRVRLLPPQPLFKSHSMAWSSSGLGHRPLKAKIGGSNPLQATMNFQEALIEGFFFYTQDFANRAKSCLDSSNQRLAFLCTVRPRAPRTHDATRAELYASTRIRQKPPPNPARAPMSAGASLARGEPAAAEHPTAFFRIRVPHLPPTRINTVKKPHRTPRCGFKKISDRADNSANGAGTTSVRAADERNHGREDRSRAPYRSRPPTPGRHNASRRAPLRGHHRLAQARTR